MGLNYELNQYFTLLSHYSVILGASLFDLNNLKQNLVEYHQ